MNKVVVLFLGRTGAGPVYTYEMVCAMSKRQELLVILSSYIDNKQDWDNEANVNKNVRIVYTKTYFSKTSFILSFFRIYRVVKLIMMINNYHPNMIYSSWAHHWDPLIYPFVKCKLKIKTIHDVEVKEGENNFIFRLLHYFSFKFANKYIILSEKYRETCIQRGIKKENILVIPLACFQSYRKDEETSKKFQNKILFFGRIVEYKGLKVLLKAMPFVIKIIPSIKLIIAGDGDISAYNEDLELLKDHIELFNFWIPNCDVNVYFNMADILVVPYIEATQSGIIPLSYSFSKPVIASDVGALSEQINNGKTGYLIKPNDPIKLADTIIKIMSSPERLYKMSQNCDEYFSNSITWDKSAKIILDLL